MSVRRNASGPTIYTYVGGNPLSYVDPLGLNPVGGAIAGAEVGTAVFPGPGTIIGGAIGLGLGLWLGDKVIGAVSKNPMQSTRLPPGVWPADRGADEWGRRSGVGAKEGRRRFHGVKQGCTGSKAKDVFGVDPETGDVYDPEGEVVGNLEDAKAK